MNRKNSKFIFFFFFFQIALNGMPHLLFCFGGRPFILDCPWWVLSTNFFCMLQKATNFATFLKPMKVVVQLLHGYIVADDLGTMSILSSWKSWNLVEIVYVNSIWMITFFKSTDFGIKWLRFYNRSSKVEMKIQIQHLNSPITNNEFTQ